MDTIAMYAGSFDPFTRGHADIVNRGLALFDKVIIAIGVNESKRCLFSSEQRQRQIRYFYRSEPRVEVLTYDGLTVDFAQEQGVRFLLRGVRSSTDMEYERTLADLNRHIASMETVLLPASQQLTHISSTVVRELLHFGGDVSGFLPEGFVLDL
ncbi:MULTISPECIES: pantetheine-phosphate adenylyltransferase [unclassified Porphyromonas]|uniref:pantetheine-phosphate adenylyltransferase n=1 Tax=unclassified Porphyromonas TaxID=2645799 RepID=UPI00052C8823|nr:MULTISPECIES: pantetheine-phosphate adenylyltransferase [unclassified Porphyromonas]KGN81888.1 phosphopantetheine adenylyltransferase [Porphyromonas sp. COT-290 OH860]KGN97166.1 phosphopantetheine adenylyltransferase [Porphyromonas sp. COT-290 OH3588]